MTAGEGARDLLRHSVATLAYRASKAVREVPPGFSEFRLGEGSRTPGQILAHMADLFDWAAHLAEGRHVWKEEPPQAWDADVERFFSAVSRFDARLAAGPLPGETMERLFQGPIADALIHTGQLAMLRRRAGGPIRGENYFKADIHRGSVGLAQAAPRVEFD